jgi:radical SAM protein with 4Fe4S-binding SPASM domain
MPNPLPELRRLIPTLSPAKILNASQVLASYYWSRMTGRAHMWGKPISIGIEPTTACNLRCPQCPSGLRSFSRPTGRLTLETFQSVIDQTHEHLVYLILYFQGEPYINPQLLDMVRYATDKNVYTMTSTNGHFLSRETAIQTVQSGLRRLIVSMDGTNKESYQQYRVGGDWDKVLSGIQALVQAKKELKSITPLIDLQFIIFKHNETEIPAVKKLASDLSVDRLLLKTAQIYDFENDKQWLPESTKFSRYLKVGGKLKVKGKQLNHCWKLWNGLQITWDGQVVPCCFDKDAKYQMGQLEDQPLNDIWFNSPAYTTFRAQLLNSRKNIDICTNCSEGTSIWKS